MHNTTLAPVDDEAKNIGDDVRGRRVINLPTVIHFPLLARALLMHFPHPVSNCGVKNRCL